MSGQHTNVARFLLEITLAFNHSLMGVHGKSALSTDDVCSPATKFNTKLFKEIRMKSQHVHVSSSQGCFTGRSLAALLALIVVCLSATARPAFSATLSVPATYPTIQAAIDAAVDGDIIEVSTGTYPGGIRWVGKSLALKGAGQGLTIIDGGGTVGCLTLSNVPASASITGLTFRNGSAENGGGISNDNSNPSISNCTFAESAASIFGGGMYNFSSNPSVTNCTFTGNSATYYGGDLFNESSAPTFANCTFSGGSANLGGGIANFRSNATFRNCTISGNYAVAIGGGMANFFSSNAIITNCAFSGNKSDSAGGGMYNTRGSNPIVTNSSFSGNIAVLGGGMINTENGNPTVTNCFFSNNSAALYGGGMLNIFNSNPTVINSAFLGNSGTTFGGGMYNDSSNPTLINDTFTGNTASVAGGLLNTGSNPQVTNCIFWGDAGGEIYNFSSTPVITYSDVQGGYAGTGNINANPLFVSASNLHVQPGSPCIDAGNNAALPANVTTDLAGAPRIQGGGVDMGAYEGTITPQQQTRQLVSQVQALVPGTLTSGQALGLIAKLNQAIASLNAGDTASACNQMGAFINQVNGFINAGKLSAAQGASLIQAARSIRTSIGC